MQAAVDLRMAAACDEVWDAFQRFSSKRRERLRLERLMRWTDRLLDDFERLNLREVPRVPQGWRPKLSLLFSSLPFEFTPIISDSPTPTEALDVILDLQKLILERKTGVRIQDLDDEEEVPAGHAPADHPVEAVAREAPGDAVVWSARRDASWETPPLSPGS